MLIKPWQEPLRKWNQKLRPVLWFGRVGEDSGIECSMESGRDIWWDQVMDDSSPDCPCEEMEAEDPLFLLYTSGSTGSRRECFTLPQDTWYTPATTHKYVFDYHEEDIYFCAADIGWITGHSYIVYGPLANGATTTMFESIPTYPNPDRYWQVIEKWKINQFYTAPTAIRAIAAAGEEWPLNTIWIACEFWVVWANQLTQKLGGGITRIRVRSVVQLWTPGGKQKLGAF